MTLSDVVSELPGAEAPEGWIGTGRLRVFRERSVATLDGRTIRLTRKQLLLLALFVENPGKLLRRERIAAEVWDGRAPGRTIDVHVARLRACLPAGAITTVVRLGYRFTLDPE